MGLGVGGPCEGLAEGEGVAEGVAEGIGVGLAEGAGVHLIVAASGASNAVSGKRGSLLSRPRQRLIQIVSAVTQSGCADSHVLRSR